MNPFIRLIFCFALFLVSACVFAASSKDIDSKHRVCATDSDCQVITLGCSCIHNPTCARADDLSNGYLSSVNRAHVERYKKLSECTASQVKSCSTAGACASVGAWISKCENQKCAALFEASQG